MCSKKQMQYILTYLQVMPSFLDFVFPFGSPSGLAHFTGFRQHDTVLVPHDRRGAIPRLGRSGSSIGHSFLLHSPSVTGEPIGKWSIRQSAIYHQFDVQTGQALWIVSRGDENLFDRLRRMAIQVDASLADDFIDSTTSFRSSLSVHQLFFEWSTESCRDNIGQLERDLEQTRKHMLIDDLGRDLGPRLNLSEDNSHGNQIHYAFSEGGYGMPIHPYVVRLNEVEMKMRDVLLALEHNAIVVDAVSMHFQDIIKHEEFLSRMKEKAHHEILRFSECVSNTLAELTLRQRQVESLLSRVQSTASLLSSALEYGSARLHNSADRMHELPLQKEKVSASMKIITLVTLVYLPGTILATYVSLKPLNITISDQVWSHFQCLLVIGFLVAATGLLYVGVLVRGRYRSPGQRRGRNVSFKEKHEQDA